MYDLFAEADGVLPGFRLQKLEVSNWGTFDSTGGAVHSVRPAGQPTLLVGQNGSGKSTLVDALLTLLVRPVVRNYNVAAGALKQERDEKTYIRGAYGRSSRDDDNRGAVEYLRAARNYYSVLLATFRNEVDDVVFTLAQVLYLTNEEKVDKVYCFSSNERSIVADFQGLERTDRLKQQLVKRGFRVTAHYNEYHGWFAKPCGLKAKAMDIFNQTVAIKDVQKLNDFIRLHMLEARPWRERIDALLTHFQQLDEAHRSLVRIRRQSKLLEPLAELGAEFQRRRERWDQVTQLSSAADSFFRHRTVEWLTPLSAEWRTESNVSAERRKRLDREMADADEEVRRLKNDIERSGGERMRELPHLIRREREAADAKQETASRYRNALRDAGITEAVDDAETFGGTRVRLGKIMQQTDARVGILEMEREDAVVERARVLGAITDDERELSALRQRQGNLPENLTSLRRRMCEELRLSERDLPFAAELIAVKSDQNAWEAAVEMVLRSFVLSLLVPQKYYGVVSRYVDGNRLADAQNRGQRLIYLKVADRAPPSLSGPVAHPQSLLRKLDYRENHSLLPWVKAELESRFDFRCCDSIEEFQNAPDLALTANRHVKFRDVRHEKDDRDRTVDRRHFVLGWDNKEKQRYLVEQLRINGEKRDALNDRVSEIDGELKECRTRLESVNRANEVVDFALIDHALHRQAAARLQRELDALESADDQRRLLKQKLKETEGRKLALTQSRDETLSLEALLNEKITHAEKLTGTAAKQIRSREADGTFAQHAKHFSAIETECPLLPNTVEELNEQEKTYLKRIGGEQSALQTEIESLEDEITPCMSRFLQESPEERTDLDASIKSLPSFLALREQILHEGLPRHEERFKERLNEKVTHEIGLLNGELSDERGQIVRKIEQLNGSLRQVEYNQGTFMQLEPKPVRNREILDFQASLRDCLADAFEGSFEADEARFVRISKLIERLRTEERWREHVTDVRRWFDFVACERDLATNAERGYYEDSTGQSGGEKAKLAFTILVASLAYQFDLDPRQPRRSRFHFVVVDEMFSKVDDRHAEYALELFKKFGLQLLIVAPLDAKARVTEPYVGCYLNVVKDPTSHHSEIYSMTARQFEESISVQEGPSPDGAAAILKPR